MNNQNLNELIGILDSLNYDEVINNKEIESLKKWIKEHKHIQDEKLAKIIKILNEILEDNLVDENERNEIVKLVHEYNKDNLSDYERIAMLNGIINGIVSDNAVNQKEIKNLNSWMINNVDLAKYTTYMKLLKILKGIDIDNINESLVLNTFKIMSFENNINDKTRALKYKIDNNKLIGNDLINLIGEKTIIAKIHRSAINELNSILQNKSSIIESDYQSIVISLTLIALLNYDGAFWKHVESTYDELYSKFSEQKISGKIREIIKTFNKEYSDETRIINYILENAIVPEKFTPSFFEFMYDIYKFNFECSLKDKNMDEEFEFIYDGMRSVLNKEKDTDELSVKVTSKTYKLIKSTKNVIINQNTTHDIIEYSKAIIKIIDCYYWDNKNICGENIYYNYGFEEWFKSINLETEKRENSKSSNRFSSSWKPEFILNGNDIYLVPPTHKIKNEYNYQLVKVVVECNNEIIYENRKPEIYDMFGGYKVIVDKIKIDNPFGNIRYYIYCDNEVIYDSKETLFRNYLIFKYDGEEYKNNTDYKGQIIIAKKEIDPNVAQIYYRTNDYSLGLKNVDIGDTFSLDNDLINLSTKLECGIVGKKNNEMIASNIDYPIYSSVEKYIIETTENINNIGIMINNTRKRLSDLNYQIKNRGAYSDYIIDLNLDVNRLYTLYAFKINDESEISKSKTSFAYINDLEYSSVQYDSETYEVNVKSTIFDNEINYMLNIKQNKNLTIDCEISKEHYNLILPLNIKLFRIDDQEWNNFDEYIWSKDVKNYSKLYTYGIDNDTLIIKGNKSLTVSTIYNKDKESIIGQYDIGSSIANNYEDETMKLLFYKNDVLKDNLNCYCKTILANPKTLYSYDSTTEKLSIKPKFYGKGNVILNIYRNDEVIYYKDNLRNKELITINNLESFIDYKIELKEETLEFSFDEDRILYSEHAMFYANKDLIGRYFNLFEAKFSVRIGKTLNFRETKLKNTFILFEKQIEPTLFEGTIYNFTRGVKTIFKTCNPVEIEIISNPINDIMELSITCEGDGLLIDFNNKTILDRDDPKATDIFTYKMDLKKGGKEWQN